jgi:hypothetical protein
MEKLAAISWDDAERDLLVKLHALRQSVEKMLVQPNDQSEILAERAILPLLDLIGRFCSGIRLDEDCRAPKFTGVSIPTQNYKLN